MRLGREDVHPQFRWCSRTAPQSDLDACWNAIHADCTAKHWRGVMGQSMSLRQGES